MEEERWWKKGGEGGIRKGIKWLKGGFLESISGKKLFTEEESKEGDETGRK